MKNLDVELLLMKAWPFRIKRKKSILTSSRK